MEHLSSRSHSVPFLNWHLVCVLQGSRCGSRRGEARHSGCRRGAATPMTPPTSRRLMLTMTVTTRKRSRCLSCSRPVATRRKVRLS